MHTTHWLAMGSTLTLGACVPVRWMPMDQPGAAYGQNTIRPVDDDPRGNPPVSLEELEALTSDLKAASELPGSNGLQLNVETSGGTASIRTNGEDGLISIHPARLHSVPLNSWAFILGHELAHQTSIRKKGNSGTEIEADVEGARYAANAGYDAAAYLAWVMHTQGPGARSRVEVIGNALAIPPAALWANFR